MKKLFAAAAAVAIASLALPALAQTDTSAPAGASSDTKAPTTHKKHAHKSTHHKGQGPQWDFVLRWPWRACFVRFGRRRRRRPLRSPLANNPALFDGNDRLPLRGRRFFIA